MFGWVRSLDFFFNKAKLRYLGLGLLLAWVYCTWFSHGIFLPGDGRLHETLHLSLLASAVGLLLLVFRPQKRMPLSPRIILVSALAVSITTASFFFLSSVPAIWVASVVGGFASSALWVGWGELFCQIDQDAAEASIPMSLAMFVMAAVADRLLPWPFAGVFSVMLPLISCLMLFLGRGEHPDDYEFPESIEPFSRVLPALVKLALCSMVCSFATGAVVTSFAREELLFGADDFIVFYAMGGVVAGLVSFFAFAHARRVNFSFIYEWAVPLIVFALAARAMDGPLFNTLSAIFACSASLYVEVLFYAIFALVTARRFCLPSETFGIFRAAAQVGFMLGGLLGSWVGSNNINITAICLFLICACVVMLPLFMHLQDRFDTTARFDVGDVGDTEELSVQEPRVGGTAEALKAIAEEFRLSRREAEVLQYLGRGRSVPYMREVMTISKSTIETHIKHIYSKTGVHSKQELLDLSDDDN